MGANTVFLYIRFSGALIKLFFCAAVLTFAFAKSGHAQPDSLQQILQARMAQLQGGNELFINNNKITATRLLPEFYNKRRFSLAWHSKDKRKQLINIITHIDSEGLNPEDYLLSSLFAFHVKDKNLDDTERVDFDILLTESLVRLGYHLRFGKVDPKNLDSGWNLNRILENEDPAAIIQAAIDAESIQTFIDQFIPRQPFYARYKKALADYRAIKQKGGWPLLPAGPSLKPGMTDSRIAILKQRLQIEGYLPQPAKPVEYYDPVLEAAVIKFQQRHGLKVDGVAGKETRAALNVPVEDRINQIRVNLERGRWVLKDVQGDFLLVNIAGFKAYLVRENQLVWTSRVIIGRPYRKTPSFKSEITYLILNPSWTVPPVILRNDVLPKARKDPAYITQNSFEVLDQSSNRIDPDNIDWSAYTGNNFPYTLRQPPGPNNALGRIKFDFPNPFTVYLHDTPHKELFDQFERTFSSGCIRIENPLQLAEYLLNDKDKWGRQKITEAIDTNETQTIQLQKPETIILLYATVVIEQDGAVHFMKDIYDRDQKLLQALDGPFTISLPEGLPEKYYQ